MVARPVKIQEDLDMESRPIAHLVQEASQYSSSVKIRVDNKEINAKSIMGMMGLAMELVKGTDFTIITEGKDEEEAASGIASFFAAQ